MGRRSRLIALERGELEVARSLNEESAALFSELDDPHGLRTIALSQGCCALELGDRAGARAFFVEALRRSRELGENEWVGALLVNLGLLELLERRFDEAAGLFADALVNCMAYGLRPVVPLTLRGLAATAAARGEVVSAARMFGAAEVIADGARWPQWSYEQAALAEPFALVAARADEPEIAAALATGRAMSDSEAAAYALATVAQQPATVT